MKRLVYCGTPEVAVPPLLALHDAGFEIPLVVSGPDKRRGRGKELSPSPVKAAALERGLRVTDVIDDCLDVDADLGVVVAYGHLIGANVLDALPMVNLHFSLLPRWRGAAPVERALLAGDSETGVCLMALAEELDTGDVYRRVVVPISDDATLDGLRSELVDVGSAMLVDALNEGLGEPAPQVGDPSYARKITTADRSIDWNTPALGILRQISIGGAFTMFRGKRLKVWKAVLINPVAPGPADEPGADRIFAGALHLRTTDRALVVGTGDHALELREVQAEGKPRQTALDWSNGARLAPGDTFDPDVSL